MSGLLTCSATHRGLDGVVVGDYDVDGLASHFLLFEFDHFLPFVVPSAPTGGRSVIQIRSVVGGGGKRVGLLGGHLQDDVAAAAAGTARDAAPSARRAQDQDVGREDCDSALTGTGGARVIEHVDAGARLNESDQSMRGVDRNRDRPVVPRELRGERGAPRDEIRCRQLLARVDVCGGHLAANDRRIGDRAGHHVTRRNRRA